MFNDIVGMKLTVPYTGLAISSCWCYTPLVIWDQRSIAMQGRRSDKVFLGVRFGRLVVIERLPKEIGKHRNIYRVKCQCDCGCVATPEISNLTGGVVTSCGCRKRECGSEYAKNRIKPNAGYGKVIPGARFERLVVIKRIKVDGKLTNRVKCQCDCGKITKSNIDGLVYGTVKSCGCLNKENTSKRNKDKAKFSRFSAKHPRTFASWRSMLGRCYNKKQKTYKTYGANGVVVCEYLREHPQNLVDLIGLRKKAKPSLDRFPDHVGNYTCGQCDECKRNNWKLNVRWATRKQQSLNRGEFNVHLTAFGKTLTKSQWMELSGLSWSCLTGRIRRGWDIEKALTTPDSKGNCYKPL